MNIPTYNVNLKDAYTTEEIKTLLLGMVGKLDASAESMADDGLMTIDDAMCWAQLSAGVILAIGELVGQEVAEDIFSQKKHEAESELQKQYPEVEVMH